MKKEIRIFVSYSSKDRELCETLVSGLNEHLANRDSFNFHLWSDKEIDFGANWEDEIETALNSCNVALLLVSSAFASSSFVNEKELAKFFKKKKQEKFLILPVLVRKYDFSQFEMLSSLNFFKTYQSDYGFNDPGHRDKLMHFDKLAESEKTTKGQLNDYFYHLADYIHKAVKNWMAKN